MERQAAPDGYLSPTQLQITVPRSDIAAAGVVNVTVANPSPGGGTSNALPFTITGIPQLSISAATATRSGGVTVTFTLKNVGTAIATAGKITIAKLDTTGTTTTLPLSIGNPAAGATTGTLELRFPTRLLPAAACSPSRSRQAVNRCPLQTNHCAVALICCFCGVRNEKYDPALLVDAVRLHRAVGRVVRAGRA